MDVSTNFKRSLCFTIKRQADAASATFIATLEALADGQVTRTWKGYTVQVTMGNGHSTTLRIPSDNGRDLTPAGITELFGKLQDDYTDAQTDLINEGTSSPTDGQIYARMMTDMRAVKSYTSNWMFLAK